MADPVRDFLMTNGDLAVVNGDFATVAGAAAVPQGIQIAIKLFLGECYLDELAGVDWLGQILVKNPDPVVVRELLREQIAAVADVTDVVGAALTQPDANRASSVTYQVATSYSSNPVVGTVLT